MKKQYYIIAALFIGGLCLTGCDNEDIAGLGKTDGNGIEAPEGYAVVNFLMDGTQTRAVANGKRAISRVDLLLYEKQEDGSFKFHKEVNEFNESKPNEGSMWPLSVNPETLPIGKTYKAVFLANVNRKTYSGGAVELSGIPESSSGNSNFSDARIKKLADKNFTENNIPYIDVAEFAVEKDKTVKITLKRIVSAHSIANYGFDGASGDITTVCKGMLAEDQPLGGQIFGGSADADKVKEEKSLMWKQLYNRLMRDFIFPVAYVLKEKNAWTDGTELDTWWNTGNNVSDFWKVYEDEGYNEEYSAKDRLDQFLNDRIPEWLSNDEKKNKMLSLVNVLYSNTDNCIDKILQAVKEKDLKQVIGSASQETGSYTLAQEAIAKQLADALGESELFPFKQNDKIKITLSHTPQSLDFDLNVQDEEQQATGTEQSVEVSENGSLDFYLLGTKDETSNRFGFTSLYRENPGDISLPDNFPGQPLSPNVRFTYRVSPEAPLSWDGETKGTESVTIYISYNNIADVIINNHITDLTKEDLTGEVNGSVRTEDSPFRLALKVSYGINRVGEGSFILTPQYGQEDTGVLIPGSSQAYFTMPMPDFGNLNVSTKWDYESSKKD